MKRVETNGHTSNDFCRSRPYPNRLCIRLIRRRVDGNRREVFESGGLINIILDPPPTLPYYVRRNRDHLLDLKLERRRDELNLKTMDYEYVELVVIRNVFGDVFVSFIHILLIFIC